MRSAILMLAIFAALLLPLGADAHPPGWSLGLGAGWTALASVNDTLAPSPGTPEPSRAAAQPHAAPLSSGPPLPSQFSSLTRTFTVFFDVDNAGLDDKAVETIALATETARQGDVVKIQVICNAKVQEPVLQYLDISERRAAAVKAELMNDGIPENDITVTGQGFEDPLQLADSEMQEIRNSRAVIDLGS